MHKNRKMKKLITVFSLLLITISMSISCSSDDSGNENIEDIVLIKKVTEILIADEIETVSEFSYQNNQLKNITFGDRRTEFTYNGDKVTVVKDFNNNVLVRQATVAYNGNSLDYTLTGENSDEKTQYYYSNGNLSKVESGYIGNNDEFVVLQTEQISFNGSNISESYFTGNFGGTPFSYKHKFTYDTKNAPSKFMNKYLRLLLNTSGFRGINENNNLSKQFLSPTDNSVLSTNTFEIIYNENDYPTEIKQFNDENVLRTITKIEYQ